jgi:twinkle protein
VKPISDDIDFLQFLGMQEQQYIEPTKTYIDDIKARLSNGFEIKGQKLPWSKTHDKVRLRPGEVSIWAGVNGHGKSLILGQVMLWLPRDTTCLIASLEMKPAATLERMCRQTLGGAVPTEDFIEEFTDKTDNMFIYDQTDTLEAERILGMCYYAAKEMKINHIVLDSLMKCGISPEDYPRQKDFVDRLCWCAKTTDVHIHLVHHIRKSGSESSRPDKFDIKGAGEITDLVDNVFIVHRNKSKEKNVETSNPDPAIVNQPDQTLRIAKQRHGEWEGTFGLWFHRASQQFVDAPDNPIRWRNQ